MNAIWLKIQPQEPLLLGGIKTGANFLNTISYLPGRILRGAWAEWLILQGQEKNIPELTSQIRIGNFFPTVKWKTILYSSPFLLSTVTCKQESGFISEPHPHRRGHGVVDTLLPSLAYFILKKAGANFTVPFAISCGNENCGSRMEIVTGFYTVYQDGLVNRCAKTKIQYYAQSKVALSRQRKAASEGMLYTATALSNFSLNPETNKKTPLIFLGQIQGPEERLDEFCHALNIMPIGSLRTRGYGKITIQKDDEVKGNLPLAERIDIFNQSLFERWDDLKRLANNSTSVPSQPGGIYFSVDLLSHGIFYRKGLPSLVPVIKVGNKNLPPIYWLTRPDFAGGWSTAWGLPKPTHLASRMSSVYVFHWDGKKETLLPYLERLEEKGIGEYCDEGFGECLICHPFHQEVKEI
jgi:CRISPR-associated protein Csx10